MLDPNKIPDQFFPELHGVITRCLRGREIETAELF